MNSIHISTARLILNRPDPVDISIWTAKGEVQSWRKVQTARFKSDSSNPRVPDIHAQRHGSIYVVVSLKRNIINRWVNWWHYGVYRRIIMNRWQYGFYIKPAEFFIIKNEIMKLRGFTLYFL